MKGINTEIYLKKEKTKRDNIEEVAIIIRLKKRNKN